MSGLLASTMSANAEAMRSRSSSSEIAGDPLGLERHRAADEVRGGELVVQAGVQEVEQPAGHVRVVPAAAPFAQNTRRDGPAAGRPEDVQALAGGQDPGQWVDPVARQAARLALAVPLLVQVVDGVPDAVAEAGLAGDGRAALAAELLDQVVLAHAREADPDEPAQAERQGLGRGQVPDRERGVLEDPAAGRGLAALERDVVAAEDAGDRRRVARAAGVLEHRRVEEVGEGLVVEAHVRRDPHREIAGPHGVAGDLALGQVERGRQRRAAAATSGSPGARPGTAGAFRAGSRSGLAEVVPSRYRISVDSPGSGSRSPVGRAGKAMLAACQPRSHGSPTRTYPRVLPVVRHAAPADLASPTSCRRRSGSSSSRMRRSSSAVGGGRRPRGRRRPRTSQPIVVADRLERSRPGGANRGASRRRRRSGRCRGP